MKIKVYATIFALVLTACFSIPGSAAGKKHHHATAAPKPHRHAKMHVSQRRSAKAEHLARLAAKEKAAWREHLAKVRSLPRAQRVALKRHNRRLKQQEQLAQEHRQALLARQKRLAATQSKAARLHSRKLAKRMTAHERRLAKRQAVAHAVKAAQQTAHEKKLAMLAAKRHKLAQRKTHHLTAREQRLAARQKLHAQHIAAAMAALAAHNARAAHNAHMARLQAAHNARQAAHNARIAHLQAAHNARVAHLEAAHAARLRAKRQLQAQRALKHATRLAKLQAAHNARLASKRSHYVAMHGDDSGGRSIHFMQTVAAGVPVKVISVDLNDPNVKVSAIMARRGSGSAEPFRQMIERANPNVAVTGTFFSLDNLKPVGDIVIDGNLIHFGGMGTALCVTPGNRADMVSCEWGRHHDWSAYDFVCACGPRLLRRGQIVLDPRAERFKDRHMLAPNSRIAVGITPGNKIVFAMTREPIYLGRLAKVMRSLGTINAMNLDAGTSTGFYYNGTTLARPGRQLTNMIVVYGRKERYERALDQLIPVTYRHADADAHAAHRQISQLPSN